MSTGFTNSADLTSTVASYGSVTLSWEAPSASFSNFALVRNQTGWPNTLSEGTLVATGNSSFLSFTDSGLNGGAYYYTLFVDESSATPQWVPVGEVLVVIPTNYLSGADFFEKLPEWYQTLDSNTAQNTLYGSGSYGQLRRFLELFGLQYDILRTEADSLASIWDPGNIRADLLEGMSNEIGFPFFPNGGYQQVRLLMANWFEILKKKGTTEGIKLFCESVTGYQASLALGRNILLGIGESHLGSSSVNLSFHGNGTSNTVASNTEWQLDTHQVLGAGVSTNCILFASVSSAPESTLSWPDPSISKRALKAGGNSNAAGYGVVDGDTTNAVLTGVPVLPSTQYTLSSQVYSENANTSGFTQAIIWYTAAGVLISTSTAAMTVANGSWTQNHVTATSPANAAYAIIGIKVAVASSTFHATQFQLELGGSVTAWEPAREVDITLYPNRVNYFYNPNFEGGTNYLSNVSAGSTSVLSTADHYSGTHSTLLTMVGLSGNFAGATSVQIGVAGHGTMVTPPFVAGDTWTVSFRIKPAQAPIGELLAMQVQKLNASNGSIGTIFNLGQQVIQINSSNWVFFSFTWQVTAADITNVLSSWTFDILFGLANGVTKAYYVDTLMVERNNQAAANDYFDGNSDLSTSDYSWNSTTNNSQSLYFPNKHVRNAQLVTSLPHFVPLNTYTTISYSLPVV